MEGYTVSSGEDIKVLGIMILLGFAFGVALDIVRATEKVLGKKRIFCTLKDIAFCMVGFFVFQRVIEGFYNGNLRWFVFVGLLGGFSLYFLFVSAFIYSRVSQLFVWQKNRFLKLKNTITKKFLPYFRRLGAKWAEIRKVIDPFSKIYIKKNSKNKGNAP